MEDYIHLKDNIHFCEFYNNFIILKIIQILFIVFFKLYKINILTKYVIIQYENILH